MLGLKKRNDLVKYIKNIPTHIGLLFHPSAEIQRYNRAASLTMCNTMCMLLWSVKSTFVTEDCVNRGHLNQLYNQHNNNKQHC